MDTDSKSIAGLGDPIFEEYPAPTLIVDGDVRVLRANRAARAALGPAGGEGILFRRGGDVLHCLQAEGPGGCGRQPGCPDCVIRGAVTQALSSGRVQRRHAVLSARHGERLDDLSVLVNAAPVEHGAGKVVVLTIEDVTDLAHLTDDVDRTERALRETEAHLRTVVDHLAEGVVVSTLEGELIHWNPAALAMHGYRSLDECRRRLPEFADTFELRDGEESIVPLKDWPLARVLRGEELHDLEVEVRRIDGSWAATWQYRGGLVRDAEGHPFLAALTVRDVTERKRQEGALRASERQLSVVLDGSNDGFWDVDLQAGRQSFSPRCFEILGERPVPPAEVARWWWSRLHAEDLPLVRGAIDAHLAGRADRIDLTCRVRSASAGFRWVRALGRTVERDAAGKARRIAGTLRDLTERIEERNRLEQALAENEKLVAELQQALGRVRTLSGLLPMCAWCKRIRNDTGYWAQIDSYISANSDAKVTHGMCPECFARMWKDD
ncbi:MAG: hypothetical protein RJA59_1160 [Pseudomonadota bacterium]